MSLNSLTSNATGLIRDNPLAATAIAAGAGLAIGASAGAVVGAIAAKSSKRKSKKSSKRKKIKHTSRGWKQDRKRRSKQKWEVAYQKRKRKSKKSSKRRGKIYYAKKTGQPYILLASGKAKFIKGKRRKK